jgi:hypothetical protein
MEMNHSHDPTVLTAAMVSSQRTTRTKRDNINVDHLAIHVKHNCNSAIIPDDHLPLNDIEYQSINSMLKSAIEMTREGRENGTYAAMIRNFMNGMESSMKNILQSQVQEKQLQQRRKKSQSQSITSGRENWSIKLE